METQKCEFRALKRTVLCLVRCEKYSKEGLKGVSMISTRQTNKIFFMLGMVALSLALSSCDVARKTSGRETIFDKIVSIPKTLILDIPKLPPLCDEIPGLKKGFVDIENGKLYYEEEGTGIPLVLLNAGPGHSHHCYHPHFSRIKDIARVIYYDARGTGKSSVDSTGKTYTIRQAVEDVENLRKALGIEKWMVLGWSFGGILAQCYALTYPEHITGLVLVAAADGLRKVKMKPTRQYMFISQEEQNVIQKIYAEAAAGKLTLAQRIYNAHLAGDWKRQSYYKPTPDEFIRMALYEWTPAPGFREVIGSDAHKIGLDGMFDDFEIPTLICEGKWDLSWNTDKVDFMRKNHPHAQLEVFEKSGHKIFADEPEKFFMLLKEFLEKASRANIVYKPGHRLMWPEPPSELMRRLAMIEAVSDKAEQEQLYLNIYDQVLRENTTEYSVWNSLANYFINSKRYYEKCLTAFQKMDACESKSDPKNWAQAVHCYKAWQGHMLDLLGRRDEAISCYQEAMKTCEGNEYMAYYIKIDRKWLQERLKTPFTWELFKVKISTT